MIYNKYLCIFVMLIIIWYDHTIDPALDAILGHKSAHSLATGPVMADPFISPLGFTMTPALSSQ
jgi:hypothetical protein